MNFGSAHAIAAVLLAYSIAAGGAANQPLGTEEAGGARPPAQQLDIAPLVSLLQSQPLLPGAPKSDGVLAPRLQPRISAKLNANLAAMPLSFEANRGQTADEVEFIARGPGYTVFLTPTEAVFALRQARKPVGSAPPGKRGLDALSRLAKPGVPPSIHEQQTSDEPAAKGAVIRMKLQGATVRPVVEGLESLPGTVNYFRGNDPAKWHSGIPTYRKVQYKDIYPGIDLVYYGNPRQLEHDFVVAPGADPGRIRIAFEGLEGKTDAPKLRIAGDGNLVLSAQGGELLVKKPHVYQEVHGRRVDVAAEFVVHQPEAGKAVGLVTTDPSSVGFRLAAYDRGRPIVIDPVVVYSTFYGGSNHGGGSASFYDYVESARSIAVDASGNAYVTGITSSTDFPTVRPKYPNLWGDSDAFVFKLSSNGQTVHYSTYLGGSGSERGGGIAVDKSGNAHVTGTTSSTDFPTVRAKYPNLWGASDAFVFKLSENGGTVRYSTYLGGSDLEEGNGIAVDASGNAYVVGTTYSSDFPTVHAKYQNLWGSSDAFVFKLSDDGDTVRYSTYLGGSSTEYGQAIAVDAGGNAYVTGRTESDDFPTVRAKYQNLSGAADAFVFKLSSDGQTVRYSTYLGGSNDDPFSRSFEQGLGIAVDAIGNAFVSGVTDSDDFPTVRANYPNLLEQHTDAFVFKLSRDGQTVHYSTYLGGSSTEGSFIGSFFYGIGIAVDVIGNAYVIGETSSSDFPTVRAKQQNVSGPSDAFIVKISDTGGGIFADPNQTSELPSVIDTPTPTELLPPAPDSCIRTGDCRKRNVVVLVHGWDSSPAAWADNTKGNIEDRLRTQRKLCDSSIADPCWVVETKNWAAEADTGLPTTAWKKGDSIGPALARGLTDSHGTRLNHVHLVGHSAGSNVIQQAAHWFEENKRNGGIAPQSLHLTFLDPYTPGSQGILTYGKVDGALIPSFSDSYVTDDPPPPQLGDALLAALPLVGGPVVAVEDFAVALAYVDTKALLANAYNFRVSGLDTDESMLIAGTWAIQNHAWPYQFYQCSANPGVGNFSGETSEPCPAGYDGTYAFGFPLSQESGYASSLQTLRRSYKPSGGCVAISIELCLDFGAATEKVLTELVQDIVDSTVTVVSATGRAVVQIGNQTYEVGTAAFQALGNFSLSQIQKFSFFSGSPVWVRLPVTITESANSLRFDFKFTQGTRGYLQAFIHDKQIYSADQQFYAANTVWHSPEIGLGDVEPGTYEIAFRLDPLADTQSVVELTNLSLGMMRAVVATNQEPIANAGASRAARLGSLVTLDGSASLDPDDGPMALAYNWLQSGGSSASLSDPANVQPTFTPGTPGTYAFSLAVSDGEATSPVATVVITVPPLGDIDGDNDVDNNDLNLVLAARNRPASGPNDLRDLDGNMKIDALDARKLTTLCTRPRCAVQ